MDRERTYLDTNIIADRLIGEKNVIAKINSTIGDTLKYSSAFVVSEHKKTFLQALRLLWKIFRDKEDNKDSKEVLNYIEDRSWRSPQEKNRYRKMFKWIMAETHSYDDALARLENLIFEYDEFFFEDISVLESEINCPLSDVHIGSKKDIVEKPIVCPLRCSMSDFLKKR